MYFRHSGLEVIMPDGKKLQNWSTANFAGLHNNPDMKVKLIVLLINSIHIY